MSKYIVGQTFYYLHFGTGWEITEVKQESYMLEYICKCISVSEDSGFLIGELSTFHEWQIDCYIVGSFPTSK